MYCFVKEQLCLILVDAHLLLQNEVTAMCCVLETGCANEREQVVRSCFFATAGFTLSVGNKLKCLAQMKGFFV